MTHPDIEYVERYGCTRRQIEDSMPIGVCERCGSDIAEYMREYMRRYR